METSAQPLSIAHVDTETGFSGGQVQVLLLLRGLQARGHRSILFSPPGSESSGGSELAQRAAAAGIETIPIRLRNDLDFLGVARLKRAFSAAAPDVVHLHTGRATWLGSLAASWADRPALTTRRMDRRVKPGLRTRWIYTRLTQRAAAISNAVADCLRAGGVPENRIVVIPSTIDPSGLRAKRTRSELRAEIKTDPESIVLLATATLHRRKGHDVLLEAVAGLQSLEVDWRLWLAGSGPEAEALLQRVDALGLSARVDFLGQRSDPADLLEACDIFVLPSRREGLGVAALEAMAAGRPVVASAVGGLAEAVVHDSTGLLVPPENPAALNSALRGLILDPERRAALGRAGPRHVAEHYLPEQMVSAYESLYREIIQERAV